MNPHRQLAASVGVARSDRKLHRSWGSLLCASGYSGPRCVLSQGHTR
jgi:hypothetical protein